MTPQDQAVQTVPDVGHASRARPRGPTPTGFRGRVVYPLTLASLGELSLYRRLRQLEEMQWWQPERLHALVDERLARILSFAGANVPFHASLGGEGSLASRGPVRAVQRSLHHEVEPPE